MLILIKSPPGSLEAASAIKKAAELAADIMLLEDAAGFALMNMLEGFCGTAFVIATDISSRLPQGSELEKGVKLISAEEKELMLEREEHSGPY